MKKKQNLKKQSSNQTSPPPVAPPTISSPVSPRISTRTRAISSQPQTIREDDIPSPEPIKEAKIARIEPIIEQEPDIKVEEGVKEEKVIEIRQEEVIDIVPQLDPTEQQADRPINQSQKFDTSVAPDKPIIESVSVTEHPPTLLPSEIGNPLFGLRRTFPALLYKILLTQHDTSIIDWHPDGKSFVIKKPILFAQCIAPHYFNRKLLLLILHNINVFYISNVLLTLYFHRYCCDFRLSVREFSAST